VKLALIGGLIFIVGYAIGLLQGRLWESVLRLEADGEQAAQRDGAEVIVHGLDWAFGARNDGDDDGGV
jgi:hypothetical protein